MLKSGRWRWGLLGVVVLGAFLLRAHDVSRIFLWLDETDLFNENVYRHPPQPLIEFALTTKETQTNTWGWPAIIWMTCQLFGGTAGVARLPSVLLGTGTVLLVFLLVYRLIPPNLAGNRFIPAMTAGVLTAVAMPQMEFSQRIYAYGATPFMAAAILLAHFEVWRAMPEGKPSPREFVRAAVLYTAVCSIALCIHPSMALLPAISLAFLGAPAAMHFRWLEREERNLLLRVALCAGPVLLCAAVLNAKNPKYGYRPYLARYYYPSLPTLFKHAYDLAAYHLNLFYNTALYWPERLNAVLLPLILLCIVGWILAVAGRWGAQTKYLALLGFVAILVPAIASLRGGFPFGGVRQTLFLSPFLMVFTALGFYALRGYRATRIAGTVLAMMYIALWAINLPRFYDERIVPYTGQEIFQVWQDSGKPQIYARGCEREIRYALRNYSGIPFHSLPRNAKPPYLLISTHYQIDYALWFEDYVDYLRRDGDKATLLLERPPTHPESLAYSGSLYFPPNGLLIYKVTGHSLDESHNRPAEGVLATAQRGRDLSFSVHGPTSISAAHSGLAVISNFPTPR